MNWQAQYLWWEAVAKQLQTRLGLRCDVETHPIHIRCIIDDTSDFAIGDSNGPIGFDINNTVDGVYGCVEGSSWEGVNYVGDPIAQVVDILVPLIKERLKR